MGSHGHTTPGPPGNHESSNPGYDLMETLEHLDTWNKLILVSGGVAALIIVVLLFVCCFGDGCLIHDCISRRKKRKQQERKLSGSLYGSDKNGVNLTNFTGQAYTRTDTVHLPSRQQSIMSTQSEQSLLSRLTSRSRNRADSSYSSMSSGRDSPSSINRSMSSVSSSSPVPTDIEKPCPPSISFSFLTTVSKEAPTAKLAIGVESCTDLPGRDYGAHCDPWVNITVNRDRRSLRRRPPSPITQFRTKTIKHAHNPFYSQTFVTDIQRAEMKDISVVLAVMDQDRHCGAVEIGRTTISLKEAKQTVEDPVKFSSHCPLTQSKKDCGELLFGLSYLPTAQRLSFSLVKITSIKVDKNSDESINPYLRIMMFNQSGRLVKKKKTTVQYNNKDPVYNETLNFEVSPHQLDSSRFLIALCIKRDEQDSISHMEEIGLQDSSDADNAYHYEGNVGRRDSHGKQRDTCLGKIAIGKNVKCEKEREHYRSVMETPRQVFSMWHTLR